MKTIIMAGGQGKRANRIAKDVPKPLIQIEGKPILQWEIECLVRQGYTDIIITVSFMGQKIIDYFGDGSRYGANITYYNEDEPLGNAGALFKLWKSGVLENDFILLNADIMFDVNLQKFIDFHKVNKGVATLFAHPNDHPFDSGLLIRKENGVVERWIAKEDDRPKWYKNVTNAGIHIINTDIFKLLEINPDDVGIRAGRMKVDLDRDILRPLVATGKIFSYFSSEYVKDMGTLERYRQVKDDFISGLIASRNLSLEQKAIFLDRDGTINKHVGYLRDIDEFELLPQVAEAVRCINKSGFLCVVVTNQPVIARGDITEERLHNIHDKMETLLGKDGAYIDAIYYCPHHPNKGYPGEVSKFKIDCNCRKPKPGMLYEAAKTLNIDLKKSWMIGDREYDIQAGRRAGCRTAMIAENKSLSKYSDYGQDITAKNLYECCKFILYQS